jgi:ABC-2 type transport system ATP-binding protein
MSQESYAIRTKHLTKRFNGFTALNDVSLSITKGSLVGYLGPNGAGKTTTIKILANLIKPTSGRAFINDIDANRNPREAMRHIGVLIEVPGVYDYLSPHEILTYFGKIYRMDRKAINKRIVEVLTLMKLADWEHKKIGSFSTGMSRRLAIAKALFHDPDILILDEPVIGLDPKGIKDIREILIKLNQEGKTILISSHLLQEVAETCDTVIFLDKGKVVKIDSVENTTMSQSHDIQVDFLTKPLASQIESISGFAEIKNVANGSTRIKIEYDGKPETRHKILKMLLDTGLPVSSFVPVEKTLEDVYVSLMADERGVA